MFAKEDDIGAKIGNESIVIGQGKKEKKKKKKKKKPIAAISKMRL